MNGAGTLGSVLLVATLATPLVLLLACLSRAACATACRRCWCWRRCPVSRRRFWRSAGRRWHSTNLQLTISLALDVPGAMLLGVAALLWSAAGVYAFTDLRGRANGARFAVCWLLTLTGSLGVFIAADLLGFYLFFAAGQPARLWTDRARR